MAVRKRTWTTKDGQRREAWVVDYYDQRGERHTETYGRKKDAEARAATVQVNIQKGTHTALSTSITVAEAAETWIETIEREGRERATLTQYRQHVAHIVPHLGPVRLAALTTPAIAAFRDALLGERLAGDGTQGAHELEVDSQERTGTRRRRAERGAACQGRRRFTCQA